jgi:hypothetical protein
MIPAAFTTTSTPPNCCSAASNSAATAASSATSTCTASAFPPPFSMAATVAFASSRFAAYPTTTAWPSAASRSATARPIPRDPPVTTATRGVISVIRNSLSWCFRR